MLMNVCVCYVVLFIVMYYESLRNIGFDVKYSVGFDEKGDEV